MNVRWWWRRLWRDTRVDVLSPLSVEQAGERLDERRLRRWRDVRPVGADSPVVEGRVRGARVRLWAVVAPGRNSWRPVFRGELLPDGGGCRLVGRIGCAVFVRVFCAVWFGLDLVFVGLLTVLGVGAWLARAPQLPGVLGAAAVSLLMGAGGLGLTAVALRSGEKEETYLREWLRATLQAH